MAGAGKFCVFGDFGGLKNHMRRLRLGFVDGKGRFLSKRFLAETTSSLAFFSEGLAVLFAVGV